MTSRVVYITGKTHKPGEVDSNNRTNKLAMDLGSLHDNLASPVPFFIHCFYERSINKKTTNPFKLSTLDCRDIAALMKDKTDLTTPPRRGQEGGGHSRLAVQEVGGIRKDLAVAPALQH